MPRGVMKSLHDRAESIAQSVWFGAISRLGVPLLLAAATWGGSTLIGLERRMAQAEQSDREMYRRVETLETRRESDRGDYQVREQRAQEVVGGIRSDISAIRTDQAAMLRALTRVEQYIDRSAAR